MISVRFLALLSTVLLVVGALLVGDAIHGSVVTGTYPVTSPWTVLRALLGVVFIALGYRFRTPAEQYASMPSTEPNRSEGSPDEDDAGDFDSQMSPLGDDGLEHVDSDDGRE